MFTGIVEALGKVAQAERVTRGMRLSLLTPFTDLQLGESVSVDGCCLTVTSITPDGFRCDLSPETLDCTISGDYAVGSAVNLERALRLQDRLGGHLVTGHIDQKCHLQERVEHADFLELYFNGIPPSGMRYLVAKGCVAVNGVSLTVNAVESTGFRVMIIPHTLELTNLSRLRVGSMANLEFDPTTKIIVEEVQRLFREVVR